MVHNATDRSVLDYLDDALSLELYAAQQFSAQAGLLASWGLTEASEKLKYEAEEESQHANRIIARIVALGGTPDETHLRPLAVGGDLRDMLRNDGELEVELIDLYSQAARHCSTIGDDDNRIFFEMLLKDEKVHSDELSQWLINLG